MIRRLRNIFRRRGERPQGWRLPVPDLVEAWFPAPVKPRVRINQNHWIRHDGGPFPFPARTPVEVIMVGDTAVRSAEYAEYWPETWWTQKAIDWRRNIRWYRIVRDPVPPIGGRAVA